MSKWYDYRELCVIFPCYILAAILAFALIPYLMGQASSQTQSYALSIGDDSTSYKIGDGKLTFTLDNNQGQTKSSFYIYGLAASSNIRQAQIFVSDLYSQDGRAINGASNISVDPDTINLPSVSTTPVKVDVGIENSKERGNFHGWLMLLIGQDITSIPLSAATDPLFPIAILWVTVGALISIATWEVGRLFDRRKNDQRYQLLMTSDENLRPTPSLLQAKNNYMPFEMSITAKKVKYNARLANREEATKFGFVNFFSIVFGISLFYMQLLSNPAVMELQTISGWDIISLIGIGLGIGSLGGFINRP